MVLLGVYNYDLIQGVFRLLCVCISFKKCRGRQMEASKMHFLCRDRPVMVEIVKLGW